MRREVKAGVSIIADRPLVFLPAIKKHPPETIFPGIDSAAWVRRIIETIPMGKIHMQ